MEKESYNIDDILSEVKKRREKEAQDTPDFEIKDKYGKDEPETEMQAPQSELTEKEPEADMPQQQNIDKAAQEMPQQPDGAQDDDIDEPVTENETEPMPETEEQEPVSDNEESEKAPEGYVDLLAMADDGKDTQLEPEPAAASETVRKDKKAKRHRIIKWIIIILVLAIISLGVFAAVYISDALKNMSDDTVQVEDNWTGMSQLIENYPEISETEASQLSSLQDMIKTWYYNGAPCSSSHVLNVLLVGEDTRGSEILDEETRADSAIIVSVNIDTKEITLTSVMRDAYAYWEDTPGDASTGKFGKINEAMLNGINTYINCVERLYKIDIDNYVIVNFDSFEHIIDELGGVDIEITSTEINEINNHQLRYGYVTIDKDFEGSSGVMRLNGKQALAYCRIRYIDSDAVRVDRQKTCLNEIFKAVRNGSAVTQLKVVKTLLPYVKTGFSSNEIVSIAKYALSQGWLSFDTKMITVPYSRINERGSGGYYYGAWCWKGDFPQDANYLQTMLYGKSSITLAQQRVDAHNCNLYGFFDETFTPCYSIIYNYSYNEATTYEAVTQEDESTTSE